MKLKTMVAHEWDQSFVSFFWSFVRMGMRAIFAQLNGCSSVGNESTQSNQSHSFFLHLVRECKLK